MKRNITYISIKEALIFYSHYEVGESGRLQIRRSAGIQEETEGRKPVRCYDNVSEASILRLAKIQEKLAG